MSGYGYSNDRLKSDLRLKLGVPIAVVAAMVVIPALSLELSQKWGGFSSLLVPADWTAPTAEAAPLLQNDEIIYAADQARRLNPRTRDWLVEEYSDEIARGEFGALPEWTKEEIRRRFDPQTIERVKRWVRSRRPSESQLKQYYDQEFRRYDPSAVR